MRAVVSRVAGLPSTLDVEELPDICAGVGELLVQVDACSVNYADWLIIQDKYQFQPKRPFVPGAEIAGTIVDIGEGVEAFEIGDRIMALCDIGGMAERVAVQAERCTKLPPAIDTDQAAVLQIAYGTAYYALMLRGMLKSAETLLILGAAGGVGLAAVQLGKAVGARVVAAVSSPDKADLVREAGADEVLIYPMGPFEAEQRSALADVFKATSGPAPDVILDPVGGDYAEAAFRSIGWGGRFVVVGFADSIPSIPLNLALLKNATIVPAPFGAVPHRDPKTYRAIMTSLLDLFDQGSIRPRIGGRVGMSQAGQAIAALGTRDAIGKIVVLPCGGK